MERNLEHRIAEAARKLGSRPLAKGAENRRDAEYVRSTKALDPDTSLARRERPAGASAR
jgi:hypothetical protein